ncbi:caspase family protein [Flagellimonas onchidii]|uniref:caspase family protein n=1 Tax=Flagellimonas onchidii TaxID=2562684 RepID=UPI0010A69761|nr:caspase family protein [Allomuricauda onchidii]
MKKHLIVCLVALISFSISANDKHALIISIGDYPKKSGWGDISSANDVNLIKEALLDKGFKEDNIVVLKDEDAKYQGIKNAIAAFTATLRTGDIAVIHVSAHGQPIYDDNGDEIDGYDEAIIPYDAMASYNPYGYKGEKHLRDDELGDLMAKIRNRLGSDGQLLLLMDSCHSGTASRGKIGAITRGTVIPFQPRDYEPKNMEDQNISIIDRGDVDENASPFIAISASAANQLNYEHSKLKVGSLSFAFSQVMANLPKNFTYRQLFAQINVKMNLIVPNQTPVIEGNIDLELFNNNYVAQRPYFSVLEIIDDNQLKIKGGKIHNLRPNARLFVCSAGTNNPKEENIISKATVLSSNFNEAIIELENEITIQNERELWVFVDQLSFDEINMKVYFDNTILDKAIKDSVFEFLAKNNLGVITKDTLEAEVAIVNNRGTYELIKPGELTAFHKNRRAWALDDLKEKLFNYVQGKYIKNLQFENEKYKFEFELLPVRYDTVKEKVIEISDKSRFTDADGNFKVRPKKDYVVVKVTNRGTEPLYFSIIEINSKGEIFDFIPNPTHKYTDEERYLEPGRSFTFKEKAFRFGPPFEKLTLKGFASNKKLDLSPIITRGPMARPKSPLEKFVGQTYTKSRGRDPVAPNENISGYSYEFVYEIVRER